MKNLRLPVVAFLTLLACNSNDESPAPTGGTVADGGTGFPDAYAPGATTFRPEPRPFEPGLLSNIQLPTGFSIDVYGSSLGNARMMAVTKTGLVYVSRPLTKDILLVKPSVDGTRAESTVVIASDLEGAHGLELVDNKLYVTTVKEVFAFTVAVDGTLSGKAQIVGGLPDGGQHGKRTLHRGPDGALYVSVGSTCDACMETNPENATLLRVGLDGSGRSVFARGLRNTIGFGWHPTTGELWGMDHGSDDRGNETPPEELNRLQAAKDYGWPFAYGDRKPDPKLQDPPGTTKAAYAAGTEPPVLTYEAHSAPIEFLFYTGSQFPGDYVNDAFVAMRGSWNRVPPSGYKVVRVHFENGQPTRFEDFASGWLLDEGRAEFGRIAGLATLPDGSLLVSEDENGMLYRISYKAP